MSGYCCEMMASNVTSTCEHHPDRFDCPDALVEQVRGGFRLIIHDGTSSMIEIAFCPWCGVRLPEIAAVDLGALEPE